MGSERQASSSSLVRCLNDILRLIPDQSAEVRSYREHFSELWSETFSPKGDMIVVFDAVPDATADQHGLNLADRVTAFDWIAWLALREPAGFSIMLLDLASHHHPGSFGVDTLEMLLPELPWVRLYRLKGKPVEGEVAPSDEGAIMDLLAKVGDPDGKLAAQFGRRGFSESQLFRDLKSTARQPSIPLPRKLSLETDRFLEPVSVRIRGLWTQSLTRAHGRHEVANLIGPLILANSMASSNDRGAAELVAHMEKDVLTGAFCRLLQSIGLLKPVPKTQARPELAPICENPEYFPVGADDTFGRFEQKLRFLLVDDQARMGYAHLLSILLTGEHGPEFPPGNQTWTQDNNRLSLQAVDNPETLLKLLDAASESRQMWNELRVLGENQFDVLLLDLRLFPASGLQHASIEETRFFRRLAEIYRRADTKSSWTMLAFEAAKDRLNGEPENPLQWVLLPLLLSEADPSLPIVVFSSTHHREISEALRSMPNVVTCFAKPVLSGYQEAEFGRTRTDLIEAFKRAGQLHEKRVVWKRCVELKDWGRAPVYEMPVGTPHTVKGVKILDTKVFNHDNPPGREDRKRSLDRCQPDLTGRDIQERLAFYFREHLLSDRYFDILTAPYELLEETLVPKTVRDNLDREEIKLFFEIDLDPAHNAIAWALRLIRNKKSHGHARDGRPEDWHTWNRKTKLAALILLFLCDFIEQPNWPPLTEGTSSGLELWDNICLKIVWRIARDCPNVRGFFASSAEQDLHPSRLTKDHLVKWEDATAYTLALACRDIARKCAAKSESWTALERLVLANSPPVLCSGRVEEVDTTEDLIKIVSVYNAQPQYRRSADFSRPPEPGKNVVYADSDLPGDRWVVGAECLPVELVHLKSTQKLGPRAGKNTPSL